MPDAAAMLRRLQCVASGGFSSSVRRTILATWASVIFFLIPGRGRLPPLQHGLLPHVDLGADRRVGQALVVQQDDPAPIGQGPRRPRPTHQRPQLVMLDIRQVQRRSDGHGSTPE